jgi:hypothetical protein
MLLIKDHTHPEIDEHKFCRITLRPSDPAMSRPLEVSSFRFHSTMILLHKG